MAGVLGIGGNLLSWTEAELAEATRLVADHKEIRPTVQTGQLYRLRSADGRVRAAQYVLGDEVVILAWRPAASVGTPATLRLAALDPAAHYRDEHTGILHLGAVLRTRGIDLDLPPGDHASQLLRLTRR
jgi:alpha-galactosidase